jgi:hypothetical protein
MARTKKAAKPTLAAADATPEITPSAEPAGETATVIAAQEPRGQSRDTAAKESAYATDPHPKISVSLSEFRGGPAMHLLRSHRFRQMQIRFDREQPDEKYLAMLAQAGWTDRSESEGVWTKQIDPQARWQSVGQMEREFKEVANAIRKGKGLEPALEGPAAS